MATILGVDHHGPVYKMRIQSVTTPQAYCPKTNNAS